MSAQTDEERRVKEWRGKGQKERVTQRDGEKIEQEIKKKERKESGLVTQMLVSQIPMGMSDGGKDIGLYVQ